MKKSIIFIMAALLTVAVPMGASAQVNLKGLKDKAKQAAKNAINNNSNNSSSNISNNSNNSRPMSLEEEHALQDKARLAARMAALNDDQKWAIEQLESFKEAPSIPKLIDPAAIEKAKETGEKILSLDEFVDALGYGKQDVIQRTRGMIDTRMVYNKRVIDLTATLPDGIDNYDPDYKLRPNLKLLQDQMDMFASLQHKIDQHLMLKFSELKTTTDANGIITTAKGAWLSSDGGHGVAKDPKDGKYKFASYPAGFTYVLDDEMKKQQRYLTWLKNASCLLANSETSEKSNYFDKCDLACTMMEQAIANNSKDNIAYVNRPGGSPLNTPALKLEALKVLQKRFPTAGYSEVIITGSHWVEVKNVFGIVVERYIEVAAVYDGGIAKQLIYLSVGNDRTTTGWGPLHLYGVTGPGGYVR